MRTRSVLLEIGTEEMPARFLPGALKDLKEITESRLNEAGIGCRAVRTFATPRRLAVLADGVPHRQKDRVREVFGPSRQAAYDVEGNPTKAALGFARSQGVAPSKLVIKNKDKGEYVAALIEEKGRLSQEILPELLRDVVFSLRFPKSMRWGGGDMRFARPIHWVLALFGAKTISFELDGIRSANRSRGHRFLSPRQFVVRSPAEYAAKLRNSHVMVDLRERMAAVREQADDLASVVSGTAAFDEELLSTVACLVEYPICVLGSFEGAYLSLPDELLISVMVGHQKYIPVRDAQGRIASSFIVVSNTKADNAATVRAGAERVIRPRLEDARFYFESDRKKKLADRLGDLKHVAFQERLGTVYDKSMRIRAIAGALAGLLCPEKQALAERAAELSKADLITGVVREFPELQGIMGMYYAREDGEEEEVARALREQYLPAFSGDRVPETDAGTVLSLTDKTDNLVSFFSIGLRPTGSEDPFALRRQALGVISILTEKEIGISLREALTPALSGVSDPGRVEAEVCTFFEQRIEPLLLSRGHEHDVVQSLIARSTGVPLADLGRRLDALSGFRSHPRYNDFLIAIKRVRNITPDEELPAVDEGIFREEEERELKRALDDVMKSTIPLLEEARYADALEEFLRLADPINTFFDKVLVMDKDEKIKQNRLALLKGIWSLAQGMADFSMLREMG